MIGCIVITLKEKTSNVSHTDKNPLVSVLPLKSGIFTGFKVFIVKIKYACAILLSKLYMINLMRK